MFVQGSLKQYAEPSNNAITLYYAMLQAIQKELLCTAVTKTTTEGVFLNHK